MRAVLIGGCSLFLLGGAACDDTGPEVTPGAAESAPLAADSESAEGSEESESSPVPRTLPHTDDLLGLTVTENADGTIDVAGEATWGDPIEERYETIHFLEAAVPVISRSLTPEQGAALRQWTEARLAAADPPALTP